MGGRGEGIAGQPSGAITGAVHDPAGWALRNGRSLAPQFLAPIVVDPRNWRDPQVGWGVVLRDGAKIPEPIRALIAARAATLKSKPEALIYSYLPEPASLRFRCLRNYSASKDISIEGAPSGVAADALPTYLLIVGTPDEVPWQLQYVLNTTRCVGRLSLPDSGVRNYVAALMRWDAGEPKTATTGSQQGRAVVWAVDHGEDDITRLMRDAIAAPLAKMLSNDPQISVRFIDGSNEPATATALGEALAERPGLIVTTSHGRTGPLDNAKLMGDALGMPVTSDHQTLSANTLGGWTPDGAIWYAHACCSAGSDSVSNFTGLFADGSAAGTVLRAIEGLGSRVAPLPTALLGADRPLRAFIGHVEPTFDWTLQMPATGQFLTSGLLDALYTRMYVNGAPVPPMLPDPPSPIGFALRGWYGRTAGLTAQQRALEMAFNRGEDVDDALLATALAARDLETLVILGDPTVAIPPLL